MRALRFERFGDPSVLRLAEVSRPVPAAGEALVEVRAAAINPSVREFYRRDARLDGVDSLKVGAVEAAGILDALSAGFESGALRPPTVTTRFPLDAGAQAYRTPGKVVLLPTPE